MRSASHMSIFQACLPAPATQSCGLSSPEAQAVLVMTARWERLSSVTSVHPSAPGMPLTSAWLQYLKRGSPRQAAHAEPGSFCSGACWCIQSCARVTSLGLGGFLLLTQLWGVSHAAGCWYLSWRAGCFGSCSGCPKAEYPKCTAALRLLYELTTRNQLWRMRLTGNNLPHLFISRTNKMPCLEGLQFTQDLCGWMEPARGALGRSLELLECISISVLSL